MEFQFNKTGAERKAFVMAISKITGDAAKYLGAPGFAYSVGGCVVSRDGMVNTGGMDAESVSTLFEKLAERGFVPVGGPVNAGGGGDACGVNSGLKAEAPASMTIELLDTGLTDAALENLQKLVLGKSALIRRALGDDLAESAGALPVVHQDGKVAFPWFRFGMEADGVSAWSMFCAKLCETAKTQKRVILKEKTLAGGDSEKFAMRCFLLKLGFIGDEYKEARRVILSKLTGDGSHKRDKDKGAAIPGMADAPERPPAGTEEPEEPASDVKLIHGVSAPLVEDDEGGRLVRGGLCGVPPTDCNYASYLRRATNAQLREAIAYMESAPGGHKGRIAVCRRELVRRGA